MGRVRIAALALAGALFSGGAVAQAPEALAAWDFRPAYALEGRAENLPGRQEDLEAPLPPMFAPQKEAPLFFGQEAADGRPVLREAGAVPEHAFTVEAWLLVHVPGPIGAVTGQFAPDKVEDAGWYLAYHDDACYFGASTAEGPAVLEADGAAMKPWNGWWYQVAAAYDGARLRLYINGEAAGEAELPAPMRAADTEDLAVWAYLNDEPNMQLGNLMQGLWLYDRALDPDAVKARFETLSRRADEGRLFGGRAHYTAGPILQMVQQDRATILWEIDRPATATVYYGGGLSLENTITIDKAARLHEVTLEGLETGRQHYYRVEAETADGTVLDSGRLTFQTAVAEDQPYSYIVIGDTETRPHVNHRLAKALWGERPNFVMNVGDLTDSGRKPRRFEWTHEYLSAMTPLFSRVPVFPVPGNGESDLYWYRHYHALPGGEAYYSFRYGNAEFFMLNSNELILPVTEQYQWLDKALQESTATWKFAAHHHPPYTSDENDYGDTYAKGSAWGDPRVRALVPLYEQYGVDIVFFGHIHSYERTWPLMDGAVRKDNGVVYIQTGGGGGNLENAAPMRTWFMRKFYRGHHYCLLNVHGGTLDYKMYDLDGRLRDAFRIEK